MTGCDDVFFLINQSLEGRLVKLDNGSLFNFLAQTNSNTQHQNKTKNKTEGRIIPWLFGRPVSPLFGLWFWAYSYPVWIADLSFVVLSEAWKSGLLFFSDVEQTFYFLLIFS